MKTMASYDQENIDAIDKLLNEENNENTHLKKSFTLIQKNSGTNVKITAESRKKCARLLFK